MKMTPDEFVDMANKISDSNNSAHCQGYNKAKEELSEDMPETLFDSFIEYAKKSKTLVGYDDSNDSKWINIKPTRDGSEGIRAVCIGFDDCGMRVDSICIDTGAD